MNKLIVILVFIFFSNILNAQYRVYYEPCNNCQPSDHDANLTYVYGERTGFVTSDISSDYGRRNCTNSIEGFSEALQSGLFSLLSVAALTLNITNKLDDSILSNKFAIKGNP